MLRYDCTKCRENIFDVVDVEHLGTLPHSWTCQGCGRVYIGELDSEGKLIVYQKGRKPKTKEERKAAKARKKSKAASRSIAPVPSTEELGEVGPAPSTEEG